MKIVFATHNIGKVREMQVLVKYFNLELIPQSEFNVREIEETGKTFVENAILKARHACLKTSLPAIADDSGLIVDALKGEPGIHSARYSGDKATSEMNIKKLLLNLQGVPDQQRTAAFHCALVYLAHPNDPTPIICEGTWRGKILTAPIGDSGFGYDPVFFDTHENCSAAQLSLDKKNHISHRAQALQLLLKKLSEK